MPKPILRSATGSNRQLADAARRRRPSQVAGAVAMVSAIAIGSATGAACYSGSPISNSSSPQASTSPDSGIPFQQDPPSVYVAKVKNVLVGLGPTDEELQAVTADPTKLAGLIDTWMTRPEFAALYQAKMLVFFELAFQQTQITTTDFTTMIPGNGIGNSAQTPLLLQNVRESLARTVLQTVGQPGGSLSSAVTTDTFMMTPPLMELYAFLDSNHVDDKGAVSDQFNAPKGDLTLVAEASQGPIPLADSIDASSPNYMHWYLPDLATSPYNSQLPGCNADPRAYRLTAQTLHFLMYGTLTPYKSADGRPCGNFRGQVSDSQFTADDFNSWKMVKVRPPHPGEATTSFFNVPQLRTLNELVLNTPRVGFFTTPAFFANWQTNTSNQMRVTLNQTLIVATGMDVDGTDPTSTGPNPPALDVAHASQGSACFGCHSTLDPSRAIFQSIYSYGYSFQGNPAAQAQKGLFAFQGVTQPVSTMNDLANVLATHPAFAQAWVQKLCYYVNSEACASSDPEFQRLVADFKGSNYSWNTLVRELLSSPITTNATETKTTETLGELVPVARRDHLCAALNARLGLTDVCGLDIASSKAKVSTITQIAGGLPSDGYGRGAPIPILPNSPSLFFRAGSENICEGVAQGLIDAPSKSALAGGKQYASTAPDQAIASFVQDLMGMPSTDPRSAEMLALLTAHFKSGLSAGATASDALKSTFVVACLSPSVTAIGM